MLEDGTRAAICLAPPYHVLAVQTKPTRSDPPTHYIQPSFSAQTPNTYSRLFCVVNLVPALRGSPPPPPRAGIASGNDQDERR